MGNTVWGGVTWRRCGAVVSPSLQEYTRYNTVASHYRNTPWYTSRPSLQTDLSTVARNTLYYWQVRIMHCIMYIIGPPTGGKQGERIYIHPTGKGGCCGDKICWYWWNFSTLVYGGKLCRSGKKLLILLKFMNIWNCAWQNRRARVSMCGNLRLGHISTEKSDSSVYTLSSKQSASEVGSEGARAKSDRGENCGQTIPDESY